MRAEVADSWRRSAAAGVAVDAVDAPITLPLDEVREHRAAHPLAAVFPLLDDVLGQAARDCDAVMAVSDASGQLLWVCGQPRMVRAAESIGFVEGSSWDERVAGTNAPGMALALQRTVTVLGGEHFRRSVQGWSCAAAPVVDPVTSTPLGVLDLTARDGTVTPQTVAMVRAVARMAESELARAAQQRTGPIADERGGPQVMLQVLGRREAALTLSDGGSLRHVRLSLRHSEILLLLASMPDGLPGDELAVLLYEEDGGDSTLRAELKRLRDLLGDRLLTSRPYRLTASVAADWLAVEAMLAAGDVAGAMRAYRGPLLPRSFAPGVVRLREQLEQSLRRAVLRSGRTDLMSTWTRRPWGSDDYEMWQAQRLTLNPRSALVPLVDGQLARLDRELGVVVPQARSGSRRAR